jgi:hypothetical protein
VSSSITQKSISHHYIPGDTPRKTKEIISTPR